MEVWNWDDRTVDEKGNITMLYAPYVALSMLRPIHLHVQVINGMARCVYGAGHDLSTT